MTGNIKNSAVGRKTAFVVGLGNYHVSNMKAKNFDVKQRERHTSMVYYTGMVRNEGFLRANAVQFAAIV